MKIILIVTLLLAVWPSWYFYHRYSVTTKVGVGPQSLGYGISDDDLRTLVCQKVCNGTLFPDYLYLDVWLSGDYDPTYWEPKFQKEQDGIEKVRTWAKTLPLCPLRSEYLSWMDFYQDRLNEARSELKNKTVKKRQDEYSREREQTDQRTRDIQIPGPSGE